MTLPRRRSVLSRGLACGLGVTAAGAVAAVLALVAPMGCASIFSNAPGEEKLPDGSFRLKCRMSLPRCLDRAEELCHGARYRVLSADDHHDYVGGQGSVTEQEIRTSEAVFRCGTRGKKLWGADESAAIPTDASASTPPPAARKQVCVPGTTQACVGGAACAGGQACLPDGSGYSACDCGAGGVGTTAADAGAPVPPAHTP